MNNDGCEFCRRCEACRTGNDTVTPGLLLQYRFARMFPRDVAHFAGEHDDQPDPHCHKCHPRLWRELAGAQQTLNV